MHRGEEGIFCEAKSPVKYSGHAGLCLPVSLISAAWFARARETMCAYRQHGIFYFLLSREDLTGQLEPSLRPQMGCVYVCVCVGHQIIYVSPHVCVFGVCF